MRPLSASELLGVWERGLSKSINERALDLLAAASPETPVEELAELSIGRRDSGLLTLREWTFGSNMQCLTACPVCKAKLELDFEVSDLRVAAAAGFPSRLAITVDDHEISVRLPNTKDLTALAGEKDSNAMRARLLERCILSVRQNGEEKSASQLPEEVVNAVIARLAEVDPQADVRVMISCSECSHQWQAIFDVAVFFWGEINAWAQRILREVHDLAFAYGWSEHEILAMSPLRRQLYLDMLK